MPDYLFSQLTSQSIVTGTDIVQTSGRITIGVAPGRYVSDSVATASFRAAHPRLVVLTNNARNFRALPEAGRIPVELAGAKGDNLIDDGPAIRASLAYSNAIGARGFSCGSAKYRVEGDTALPSAPTMGLTATAAIHDWGGAVISRQNAGRGIVFDPSFTSAIVNLPLAADVIAGTRTVTLTTGGGASLVAGDTVLWQLGELPYDTPETLNWDIAKVTSIAGDVVTLDKPIPTGLTLSTVTGANKRLRKMSVLRDFTLRNVTFDHIGAVHEGVSLYGAQRVRIERVGGRNCSAGLVVAQYCDGLTIDDCWLDTTTVSQPSFGAAFSFAECRNVLLNHPRARGALNLVKVEAGAEATVIGGHFENTLVNASGESLGASIVVLSATGRGSITAHDLTITGYGGYNLAETSNGQPDYTGGILLTGTTRLKHPTSPFNIPLEYLSGTLEMEIGGLRQIYNFQKLRTWKRRFQLRDGQMIFVLGPPGILVRARVYTSEGVTVGNGQQLHSFYVGRNGDNGENIAQGSNGQLVPGQDIAISMYGGTVGGALWNLRANALQILVGTAEGAGLNAANEFVEFEGWIAEQKDINFAVTEAAWRSTGGDRDPMEALFPSYDLPAIAAGGELVIELAIPDMSDRDFIEAVRITGGFGGLTLVSSEALSGKARLVFGNPGTSAIDRTAADLGIEFSRPLIGA
jgi:hypothetical protein